MDDDLRRRVDEGLERFQVVTEALESELDWPRLGEVYCHEGGESFFTPEQVAEHVDAWTRILGAMTPAITRLGFLGKVGEAEAAELGRPTPDGRNRSLYLGAALAELWPALFESLVAQRDVVLVNIPGPEPEELNRALYVVGEKVGLGLPPVRTDGIEAVEGSFDHAWMTSVLTDPEAFPSLHDRLYERTGEDATGRGDEERERREAIRLTRELVRRLAPPALLTTTDEELPFVREACSEHGWELEVPTEGVLSSIVGDVIRFCRVSSPR